MEGNKTEVQPTQVVVAAAPAPAPAPVAAVAWNAQQQQQPVMAVAAAQPAGAQPVRAAQPVMAQGYPQPVQPVQARVMPQQQVGAQVHMQTQMNAQMQLMAMQQQGMGMMPGPMGMVPAHPPSDWATYAGNWQSRNVQNGCICCLGYLFEGAEMTLTPTANGNVAGSHTSKYRTTWVLPALMWFPTMWCFLFCLTCQREYAQQVNSEGTLLKMLGYIQTRYGQRPHMEMMNMTAPTSASYTQSILASGSTLCAVKTGTWTMNPQAGTIDVSVRTCGVNTTYQLVRQQQVVQMSAMPMTR